MMMSWNITNKSNMYCKYYNREAVIEDQHEINTVEGKSLIDEVAKAGFKIMEFSGGEPLVRPDIYDLIKHAVKVGIRPVLLSNGTFITKRVAQELKNAGVIGIEISLDSLNPKKHDEFLSYTGAWREAVIGMKNCREAGLRFQIHTTVMNWNKDEIIDITDFAIGMGAVAHHIFFLVPTCRGTNIEEESLNPEQYERLLKEIILKQNDVNIELKPTCAPEFMKIAKEMGMNTRFSLRCLAGTSYCIISPSGDVQPSAYLNLPIGNVRETPFSEIWRDNPILKELRSN